MISAQLNQNGSASQVRSEIYGYARASSDPQVNSPDMQAEDITRTALTIDPSLTTTLKRKMKKWIDSHIFTDAGKSGEHIPYYERPAFKRLMLVINPGDHLIVWRWDRIDRGAAFHQAIEWFQKHLILLHVLEAGSGEYDLADPYQEFNASIHGAIGKLDNAKRRLASMRGRQFLKDRGAYIHGQIVPGFKRVWRGGKRAYRHDEAERLLCREIGNRVRWGRNKACERAVCGITAVYRDFLERGEVTSDGAPWQIGRMRKIARWWLECMDRGLTPWVDAIPFEFGPSSKLG